MQTHDGIDVPVFFCDGDGLVAALPVDADGEDAFHAIVARAADDVVESPPELGKIEMRVGVGEHDRYQRTTDEAQVKPPPKTTMSMWSPRLMRPLRCASSRAMATAAADVLP